VDYSYRWSRLNDLPGHGAGPGDTELHTLRGVWLEQKEELEQRGLVATFTERLIREYAIEGGIIERAYTLDRGITRLLIDRGIDASLIPHNSTNRDPQQVALIIHAHKAAVESVFDLVKKERPLSHFVIRELHAALLEHESLTLAQSPDGQLFEVPFVKGAYKTLPNNPKRNDGKIHEYCPPEHVTSEIDQMLRLHVEHEQNGVPAEVEAAWLHHVFTQIHPFQDGNGRVARLLASYVFIKASYFPLTLTDAQDREAYIAALETADGGDPGPLVRLFSGVQKRTFVKVLGIAGTIQKQASVDAAIAAARQTILSRKLAETQKLEITKQNARALHVYTNEKLESIAAKLRADVGSLSPDYHFRVDSEINEGNRRHYFKGQVIEVAKTLDYWANATLYHDWTRLILKSDDQSEILISLHGIGTEYRGVLAGSVGIFRRIETEEGDRETTKAVAACDAFFQLNYLEDFDDIRARFESWLESSLARALGIWRSGL